MQRVILEGSKISGTAGGISNYAINLFGQLKMHEAEHHVNLKLLLLSRLPRENVFFNKARPDPAGYDIISYLQFIKLLLFGTGREYALFHSPYMFLPPRRQGSVNVISVHDLINFEKAPTLKNRVRAGLLRRGILRADHFICSSVATREKLRQLFPAIRDHAISVIHLGTDEIFFTKSAAAVSATLTTTPYLLYVGLRGDYKNFDSLLAFIAQSRRRDSLNIICVGGGAFSESEAAKISRGGLEKTVLHAGSMSIEELKYLYQNAKALAYTSLQEGFGIPILEAMASGCPVMCGDFSSMKEIAGGHAVLMKDFSPASFEDALDRVEKRTAHDQEKAKLYAATFTWEKAGRETMAVYEKLLKTLAAS